MQQLMDFINKNKNWKTILQGKPYCIQVREDGEYILLKYNQLDSDLSNHMVQECRGCIIRKQPDGMYRYVCRPFDKFFNYGEPQAADIDWKSARVTEKIDGSLIKAWYDNGAWHLSTNGTIDAYQAKVNDQDITFGDLFARALKAPVEDLYQCLDQHGREYTYMFELTAPESRVVIPYKDGVYFLARRNTMTGQEDGAQPCFYGLSILTPQNYLLGTLAGVIRAAENLPYEQEGYVVDDAMGHRIKVKSPAYLAVAHMWKNGYISKERILQMILGETIDDFAAYFPQYNDQIADVKNSVSEFEEECNAAWKELRKQIAMLIQNHPLRAYLFDKLYHPGITPIDSLKQSRYLLSYLKNTKLSGDEPEEPNTKENAYADNHYSTPA